MRVSVEVQLDDRPSFLDTLRFERYDDDTINIIVVKENGDDYCNASIPIADYQKINKLLGV